MEATEDPHVRFGGDAKEAGRYFRYMAEFVGFTQDDEFAIQQSGLIIEKHLPAIIGNFYTNLLQYPPTRKIFLKKDGSLDEDYLELRMLHQANFWRRCAGGVYDDDFARFVNYVGRAHTSRGADPHIYIAERYVIGMVGFVQHAIIDALNRDLHAYDPDLEMRAIKGWNKLCMVILEMLARAYGDEHHSEILGAALAVDAQSIMEMSVEFMKEAWDCAGRSKRKSCWLEMPARSRKASVKSSNFKASRSGYFIIRTAGMLCATPVCTGADRWPPVS